MTGIRDGWLVTPYSGHDLARVEIGVGPAGQERWQPAFLDWVDGQRVAKIRPPGIGGTVWLSVNGVTAEVGAVTGPPPPEPPIPAPTVPRPPPSRLGRRRAI